MAGASRAKPPEAAIPATKKASGETKKRSESQGTIGRSDSGAKLGQHPPASNPVSKRKLSETEGGVPKATGNKKQKTPGAPPVERVKPTGLPQGKPQPSTKSPRQTASIGQREKTSGRPAETTSKPLSIRGTSTDPSRKPFAEARPGSAGNSWPSKVGKQKVKGLMNPHNWCYRRSTLQSLIACPQLFVILDNTHPQCSRPCVTCALHQLLVSYQTTSGGVSKALKDLDSAIKATGKRAQSQWRNMLTRSHQEDSHEFLHYLLETIGQAKGVPKAKFSSTFELAHRIVWHCQKCKKEHSRVDPPGTSLSLSMPRSSKSQGHDSSTLAELLDSYHRENNTEIRCDKCKSNLKRTRILRVENPPDVLTIQLNRFSFTGSRSSKNNRAVEFPEKLDLSPWTSEDKGPAKYRLQAVVVHQGSTPSSGHYTSVIRGPDNQWQDISDDHVAKTSFAEAFNRREQRGRSPYVLFYLKQ